MNKELQKFRTNVRIVEIASNGFAEENFLLLTTLTNEQIELILQPLVEDERDEKINPNNDVIYDNEVMTAALVDAYPNDIAFMYDVQLIEKIQL
jgi:hypothetical protein